MQFHPDFLGSILHTPFFLKNTRNFSLKGMWRMKDRKLINHSWSTASAECAAFGYGRHCHCESIQKFCNHNGMLMDFHSHGIWNWYLQRQGPASGRELSVNSILNDCFQLYLVSQRSQFMISNHQSMTRERPTIIELRPELKDKRFNCYKENN